jgi:hypothetical protein
MSYFCFGSHNEVSLCEVAKAFALGLIVLDITGTLLSFQFLQRPNVSGILASGYIVTVNKSTLYNTFVFYLKKT